MLASVPGLYTALLRFAKRNWASRTSGTEMYDRPPPYAHARGLRKMVQSQARLEPIGVSLCSLEGYALW